MMWHWLCGVVAIGLLSGCTGPATTDSTTSAGNATAPPAVVTGQSVEKYVEPGASIVVDPPNAPECQDTQWKPQGPYETQYGVSAQQNDVRQLLLLTTPQPQDYDVEYEWNCDGVKSPGLLPYRVRIHVVQTFFPRRENRQWTYTVQGAGAVLQGPSFTNQTRAQGELKSDFRANGGSVSFRAYLDNSLSGGELLLRSVSYQFYRSGTDGDADLAFDPPIALLSSVYTLAASTRTVKSIVSFTTDTEIPGWAPFAGPKELTITTEAASVTLADGVHDGFRVTLTDSDGRAYLPPMILVKGEGIVAQELHDVFVRYLEKYLGTSEVSQMTLVSGSQ